MISRRTILTWLGLLPAMVAAAKVAPAIASASPARAARVRRKTVLEADGSSTWRLGDKRYLDAWLKTQQDGDWLEELKQIVSDDAKVVEVRVAHWRDFKKFQCSPGVTVDAEFFRPGERLRDDPPPIAVRKLFPDTPVFQFSEKDW